MNVDIYEKLVASGCEVDSWQSDLYVKSTPESRLITSQEKNRSFFFSAIDGSPWIEIPFAYTPFWSRVL